MAVERTKSKSISMNSEPERIPVGNNGNGIPEEKTSLVKEKNSYVRHWTMIVSELPEDFSPHYLGFVRDYFRGQLRIARGQRKKAKRIIDGLVKRTGFVEFEDQNQPLFAAIDIAVRGSTNRKNFKGDPVEPSFTIR